jgi:hypothetical protein
VLLFHLPTQLRLLHLPLLSLERRLTKFSIQWGGAMCAANAGSVEREVTRHHLQALLPATTVSERRTAAQQQ